MSSGFSGGTSDFFSAGGRSSGIPSNLNNNFGNNLNPQQQFPFRSPLSGIVPDPATQIGRPEFIGKRSLADFQQNHPSLGFYLRNVKPRPNYQHTSSISPLPPVSFSPEASTFSSLSSVSNSLNSRFGLPVLQQHRLQPLTLSNRNISNVSGRISYQNLMQNRVFEHPGMNFSGTGSVVSAQESEKKMMNYKLQELEKQLLGDEDEGGESVSVVTNNNSEWSETIQNLMGPTQKSISPSPTSSSSSSSSTSASPSVPCPKQSLIDAAVAISEGRPEIASEILTRLQKVANAWGTPEQRLAAYMVSALRSRVNPVNHHSVVSEIYSKEHTESTQMLYDVCLSFRLSFMAANLAIIEAASELGSDKIHVVDFEIGMGRQYVHLLHALAAAKRAENKPATAAELRITSFTDSGGEEKLKLIGEKLKELAESIGVSLNFLVKNLNISDLSREKLEVQPDETLAVNFAFKLYRLPDESVTTDNLRDELLRRVKGLSPAVMTVLEQEMNGNTAPLSVRVRDACEYYGALFDSLDSAIPRDNEKRVRIEEGLGRRIANSVACEGRDRVERCEMFGKWRARVSMAGFQQRPMSQRAAESLNLKLNSVTRGKTGFTVNEQSGGICFGWMGRILTVASAWR